MIRVSNLCKSYGGQDLFSDVTFTVNPRERVGLVGRNGHGKTTLFRLILGQEIPDSGRIIIPKNVRLGYLKQHLNFTQPTILQETCLGLPEGQKHDAWRAEKILHGLGFTSEDMNRPPAQFSGGFQVRLNLAQVLVSDPDVLLLDEPTNYLDIISIRWLTRFLQSWKDALMLITHDRGFMDSVTTHTLGIHRTRIRKIQGSTEKLYEQIASEEEIYEKTRLNDEKRRKEVEQFIRRFRAKARLANMVQSRVKTLAKKQKQEKLQKIETLDFSFSSAHFPAKVMMEVTDISYRYSETDKNLFENLNFTLTKNDRICVVGQNGKGKTTLLKVLAGVLQPRTGSVKYHSLLQVGYFEQTNTAALDPNKTIEEEIFYSSETCLRQKAREVAGAMMFSGDLALKKISVLSGGEKSRVLLGKLLVSPFHLLLLDEPTNHLDMESCDSLMAAIDAFDGAVVLITHNEMFLHTLANRFIVFDRGKQFLYEGCYQNFLDDIGWESDATLASGNARNQPVKPDHSKPVDKKFRRKQKAELIQQKSQTLKPLESRIAELEKTIISVEKEISQTTDALIQASKTGDRAGIADLAKKERELRSQSDRLYNDLDAVTREFEQKSQEFERLLAGL
ncbi:MAG: ATP-binding cassette domain-containing protein [bacterium]